MMSLKEVSLRAITVRLYLYKLKGHSGFIYSLIIAQLLGLLFSLGPRGATTTGNPELSVSLSNYSTDMVVIFTIGWIMLLANWLPSQSYRNLDFSLVSNRLSSNLSNFLFLLTVSFFGGVTSTLMGGLQRIILFYTSPNSFIIDDGFTLRANDLLLGMFITTFYIILFAALFYFVRTIIEHHKIFIILIPAVLIGLGRIYPHLYLVIFEFFAYERSLPFFIGKASLTSILLFGMSLYFSNGKEVRQ